MSKQDFADIDDEMLEIDIANLEDGEYEILDLTKNYDEEEQQTSD